MNALNLSQKLATSPPAGCFLNLLVLAGMLATAAPLSADSPTLLFVSIGKPWHRQ
jgi:hypothetical protein